MEDGPIKKNILFLVEGKTEGASTLWGKGLWNILREETIWMRENKIFHQINVRNGKQDLISNLSFYIRNHLSPSKKTLNRYQTKGIAAGDYVIILMDMDCSDVASLKAEIENNIDRSFKGYYSMHFAAQEIEAWMVADPNGFRSFYRQNTDCIVKKIAPLACDPEKAECKPQISDRLKEAVEKCGEYYRKTIEGPQLLKAVDPSVVASKCSYFMRFRNDLRDLIKMPDPNGQK